MSYFAADLQKFMATGSMPSQSLEMSIRPPASYGITTMPQPSSAPIFLYQHMQASDLAGLLQCTSTCYSQAHVNGGCNVLNLTRGIWEHRTMQWLEVCQYFVQCVARTDM